MENLEIVVKNKSGMTIVWSLLLLLVVGTFTLANKLENRGENAASIFFKNGEVDTIYLSAGRAEPIEIEAEIGNEIVFIVLDESRHNIAEERTNKHDARLESGEFGSGESYSLSFSSSGMYSFYDRMNTDIHVVINVKK